MYSYGKDAEALFIAQNEKDNIIARLTGSRSDPVRRAIFIKRLE